MTEGYAYAWYRRSHQSGPGNWTPCTPAMMATIIKTLRQGKGMKEFPIGEVFASSILRSRYEYICVETKLSEEVLHDLKLV